MYEKKTEIPIYIQCIGRRDEEKTHIREEQYCRGTAFREERRLVVVRVKQRKTVVHYLQDEKYMEEMVGRKRRKWMLKKIPSSRYFV